MSNKTPENSPAKTASAPKLISLTIILLFLVMIGAFWLKGELKPDPPVSNCYVNVNLENTTIRADEVTFQAEVAKNSVDQQQGLSARDCLDENRAMLFSYDNPGNYCFWMKDMSFAIDMIWLDADKKVVTIKSDAKNADYPETYCPEKPAQYVIEVNAGVAQNHSWQIGTQFTF